jgi:hypothetical protein
MSIEKVLAVMGAVSPIIAIGTFLCVAIERARKKKSMGLTTQMCSTVRCQSLFRWFRSCVISPRSRRSSVDREEIERRLRTKEEIERSLRVAERRLRAEVRSKATPEVREYLMAYIGARKGRSDPEIVSAEVRLTAQIDREADVYRLHRDKYGTLYRAAVIAVATVAILITIYVGAAVAVTIIRGIIHDFEGHGRVTAVREHPSARSSNVVTKSPKNLKRGTTPVTAPAVKTAKSARRYQSNDSVVTPPSIESKSIAGPAANSVCITCLTEIVTNEVTRTLPEVSSGVNGAVRDLTNTTTGTVYGLTNTVTGTVHGVTNTVGGLLGSG